jgi:hypothetical protein
MINRDALRQKTCLWAVQWAVGLALFAAPPVFAQSTTASGAAAGQAAADPAAAERARLREDLERLEALLRGVRERLQALESAATPSAAVPSPVTPAPVTASAATPPAAAPLAGGVQRAPAEAAGEFE